MSHAGSFGWNVATGELYWSDEMYQIFEIGKDRPLDRRLMTARIHPEDRDRVSALEAKCLIENTGWQAEYRLLRPDGGEKHLNVATQVSTNDEGSVEVIGAVMDVTAAKQARMQLQDSLNEKDALLKEVHHRVKNNLQLISSLLNLQASRIPDQEVAELFTESRNRVRSMALVHENLYRAGNFSGIAMAEHIKTLCTHLAEAYSRKQVRVLSFVQEFDLDLDRAISIGLIINELVSNS